MPYVEMKNRRRFAPRNSLEKQMSQRHSSPVHSALNLTQEQFTVTVWVTAVTSNHWENDRTQSLPLALRQIKALLEELTESSIEARQC